MAIREKIVIDSLDYMKGLSDAERAAIKFARKQDHLFSKNEQTLKSLNSEIQKLKRARDASNSTASIKKYDAAIEALEKQQRALRKETDKYRGTVKEVSDQTERSGNKMKGSLKKIGTAAKLWITGVAVSAFLALKNALGVAQTVEETASKFDTVLGPSVDKANTFIEENARLLGLSDTQAKELIATTAAIAQGMDFVGREASQFSMDIVKLAGDLQSFNDVPIEQTHRAITSALTGEREALKTLGIVIRETDVQEKALVLTGKRHASLLTDKEKAMATFQLITEKAGVAVGDLERTEHSAANRSRQVRAELINIWETLSSKLTPALQTGLNVLKPFVRILSDWVDTPISEEMKRERDELNNLVHQITEANISQEKRNGLIVQLQQNYPDFLENLDSEKVSNEELAAQLQKVNEKYADRIIVQKQTEKVLEAQEKRDEALVRIADEKVKVNDHLTRVMREQGVELDLSNKTTEERIKLVKQALREEAEFGEGRSYLTNANEQAKALVAIEFAIKDYAFATQDLSDAEKELSGVAQRRREIMEALGLTTEEVTESQEDHKNEVEDLITTYKKLKLTFEEIQDAMLVGGGSLHSMFLQDAVNASEEFNNVLTRLNNELSAGIITQEEYNSRSAEASESYLNSLKAIYNMLKDNLTPEQEKMFKAMFDGFKKTEKEAKKTKKEVDEISENLGNIADMASGLLSVADAFGDMDDNLRNVLRGSIDVFRNLQNIKKLEGSGWTGLGGTGLAGVVPVLGLAGGVASMLSGMLSGEDNSEAHKEMVNSMKSLRREIAKNTDALLKQGLVGSDISQGQIQGANSLIDQLKSILSGDLLNELMGVDFHNKGLEDKAVKNFIGGTITDILNELSESEIPGLENINQFFEDLLGSEAGANISFDELQQVLDILINGGDGFNGLNDILSSVNDNLGQFGNSLEGAIERFNLSTKLGLDEDTAFDTFIEDVIGLIGGDANNELVKLLQQIANASTPEERKALANDLFTAFQNNASLLGDELTGADLQEIIDMILSQGSGSDSGSQQGYSRSVQIARTITDIQANEMIVFLEWIGMGIWELVDMAGGNPIVSPGAGSLGMNIQLPLPVKIENWGDLPAAANTSSNTVHVGGVNIDRSFDMSDAEIDELTRLIAGKIRAELRGRQF